MPSKVTKDPEIKDELLEAAVSDMANTGDPTLMRKMMHNLGEDVGVQGQMGEAFTVDPERDESYVEIYSTINGVSSTVLKSMLPKVMRKRVPRDSSIPRQMWGRLAFDFEQPLDMPVIETKLCMFHPDHPLRPVLNENGLAGMTCGKSNLPSEYEALQHASIYHRKWMDAYVTIESRQREDDYRKREDARAKYEQEVLERLIARDK